MAVDRLHKFIECLLPVTACNMRCSYCYVAQENRRSMKIPDLNYDLDTIRKATTKERMGGTCFFNICGAGETLLPKYTVDLVRVFLDNGHYINITTNGTYSKQFDRMITEFPPEYFDHMQFAFSYHYLELIRLHSMDRFFANVHKVHDAGASILVQFNLTDEYLPHIDTVKRLCLENVGAYPQVAATRREEGFPVRTVVLDTELASEEYISIGKTFNSPLFDFTIDNFNVPRREFCYAGDWTYSLNLQTGMLRRCYNSCYAQNIFKNPKESIRELAIGHHCNSPFCFNSSHFMSAGVIPELDTPTYVELRDRPEAGWYQGSLKQFMSQKLADNNAEYGFVRNTASSAAGALDALGFKTYSCILNHRRKSS